VADDVQPVEERPTPLPFQDLEAPEPLASDPPTGARWLAFGSILISGLLGATVGYGIGDLMGGTSTWAGAGALIGAVTAAVGVGVVANLTLRAMNEWQAVDHPEAESRRAKRRNDRAWTRRDAAGGSTPGRGTGSADRPSSGT
jgi:hypothetical protein